ncbi:MAG TPA: polysaccharide biosynthesis tyrosine autokinase [Bacteroidota bacterium]|nr:polysaccharide biosynthesis tyrosine autokinase [Bacteroidota bacterium]
MATKPRTDRSSKSQPTLELSLRDYIEILERWKYVIMGITAGVFIAAVLYTYLGEFIYEGQAIVQVSSKAKSDMEIGSLDLSSLGGSTRNLMKEIGILKSRAIAEDVLALLKKNPVATLGGSDTLEILLRQDDEPSFGPYAHNEVIIDRLEDAASFDPDKASDVIFISALSPDPKEAAIIANTYADAYYQNNLNASRRQLTSTREFLERTLQAKKAALDTVEDALRRYQEQHGSIDQESQTVVTTISNLEAQRDETEIAIETAKNTISSYVNRLDEIKRMLPKNQGEEIDADTKRIMDMVKSIEIQKLLEQISALEQERDLVKEENAGSKDQDIVSKRISDINAQIAALHKKINDRMNSGSSKPDKYTESAELAKDLTTKITDAQMQLQSLEIRHKALVAGIAQNESRFQDIPRINIEYARLQRTDMTLQKVYSAVEEKYQSALIAEQSEFGYVDVLQRAVPPTTHLYPNIPKNLGFGFFIGLVLGVSSAFLINYFDDRIHKPEDIKRRGLSVLTVIPAMDSKTLNLVTRVDAVDHTVNGERGTVRRDASQEELEPASEGPVIDPHLITAINPYSRIADSYRRLRTSVQYWKKDTPIKSILMASGAPQEGKSLTTANLAVVFAQTRKKVLIVDVDLRRPTVHEIFNLDLEPGLTEVLFGEVDLSAAIRHSFIENLDILPCGSIPLNPTELIGSVTMKNLKAELDNMYDIVMYDSPPILLFTDSELLVALVDAVVFVVKTNSTTFDSLDHSVDIIEGIRLNLAGIVVNQYQLNRLHRGYYHLHGEYYYQQKYAPKDKT